ncbi:hypothetical protein ACFLU6_01780 [Acidobacteriota bacterium]
MRGFRSPWTIIVLSCAVLLLFSAGHVSAQNILLKATKANQDDVDLVWEGGEGQFPDKLLRSKHKNKSFGQDLATTFDQSFRDPYVLGTYEIYYYSVDDYDCSEPNESLVRGRVLCADTGDPKVGCEVSIRVGGCPEEQPVTYTVSTDSNGLYEVCIICPACDRWDIRVEACCGQVEEMVFEDCPPAIAVPNINCECGNQGPCPDPGQTLLTGKVICQDNGDPMTECEVELEVRGCPNVPSVTYTVVTDENGEYEICVDCPGCDVWIVVMRALCCEAIEDPRIQGCPEEVELPDLECTGCGEDRPCGEDSTKVWGYVLCQDDEQPMAGCEVDIEIRCGTQIMATYTVTTDQNGLYEVCVECPTCDVVTIVATAQCCSAITDPRMTGCPPDFQVDTLNCTGCSQDRPCGAERTEIIGRVICDDTELPIPDCTVDIIVRCNNDTFSYEATTDSNGYYSLCIDCPGCTQWTVVVEPRCCGGRAETGVANCPPQTEIPLIRCLNCP